MSVKEFLYKYKRPLIIIIILFAMVFFLRIQSIYISGVPDQIKPIFQNSEGLPYFSEMDSYYNYRLTKDFIDHGYLGDTIINGVQWDLHSYYPPGRQVDYPPLIVYVTAFIYKLVNLFSAVSLTAVCFWTTTFIASLCVIPAYLFVRRITNDFGGITAGILVGTAPIYFSHTFAGFFDTDMFNMVLPLLVVWLFIESIYAKNIRIRTILVFFSAISMLLFSMAWVGWWYIFYLVVGSIVIYLLISNYFLEMETIKPSKEYKSNIKWFFDQPELYSLILFIVLSSIFVGLYFGFTKFTASLLEPIGFTQLQSLVQTTAYPNVYVSVSELQIPTIWDIIGGVGGIVPFVLGIVGIFMLYLNIRTKKIKKDDEKENVKTRKYKTKNGEKADKTEDETEKSDKNNSIIKNQVKNRRNYLLYIILFSFWLLITAYAMTKGVRFVATFSLPIALGAGIFVGLSVKYIRRYIKNPFNCSIAALVLIVLVVFPSVSSAYSISSSVVPGTDDYMLNSLEWINKNTPKETVITSWWDFGHLFATVADRPVTFDGGTQNTPRAYWVGKALLTNNESLSAGILRMLTSSGDSAYLTLDNYTNDTAKSVEILNNVLGVDKQTAQSIMIDKYELSPGQAQNILKYTHPDNPSPHVFITSQDMLGKAGWWSYFGSWDFKTNSGQKYIYSSGYAYSQSMNNTTVIQSEDGVVAQINGSEIIAGILVDNNTIIEPYKLIYIQDGEIIKDEVVLNESPIDIILIKENDTYQTIAMSKELEDSMFTRLYIMKDADLNLFKLAYQQPGVMVWSFS